MNTVTVPLIECKSGDLTDVSCYTAVSILTALSKVCEHCIYVNIEARH